MPVPCKHTFNEKNIESANAEARLDAIGYCQRKHGKANCICTGGKYFIQENPDCKQVVEGDTVKCEFTTKNMYIGTCNDIP